MTEIPKREETAVERGGAPIRSMLLGAIQGIVIKIIVNGGLIASIFLVPAVGTLLGSGAITLSPHPNFVGFNLIFLILNFVFGYLGVRFGLAKEWSLFRRIYSLVVGLIMMVIGIALEIAIAMAVAPHLTLQFWLPVLILENCGCLVGVSLAGPATPPTELPLPIEVSASTSVSTFKNCRKCGSRNPGIAKFCWKCRAPLQAPKSPEKTEKKKVDKPRVGLLSRIGLKRGKRDLGRATLTSVRILGIALVFLSMLLPWLHVSTSGETYNPNCFQVSSLGPLIKDNLGPAINPPESTLREKADNIWWNSIGATISLIFGAFLSFLGAKASIPLIWGLGEFTYFCLLPMQDFEKHGYVASWGIGLGYLISLVGLALILLSGGLSWIHERWGGVASGVVTFLVFLSVVAVSGFILADILLLFLLIFGMMGLGVFLLVMKKHFTASQVVLMPFGGILVLLGYLLINTSTIYTGLLVGGFLLILGLLSFGCIVLLQWKKRRRATHA